MTEPAPQDAPSGSPWRSPLGLTLAALALGIAVEVLFDGHTLGVSAVIWAVLTAAVTLGMAAAEHIRPSLDGLWLVPPIVFSAAMLFLRLEPMTAFLNVVLVLALFALWVRVFRSGGLKRHGWVDLGLALAWVPLESWIRPWSVLGSATRQVAGERGSRSRWLAVLRGVLIALPVVVFLGALLAAADVIFADAVQEVLRWLRIETIVEYLGRATVVIISGLFCLGALVVALRDPGQRRLIGEDKPVVAPFLGFIESAVVLGAVDLLFLVFVVIQFAYLFGGQANITAAGYTYAEYARRGFGELVAVAVLTLGLILALGAWARRTARAQRTVFNSLSAVLVVLVGVILASALIRLLLYEGAYGFTRLRTYTHVAIFWMGALFLAFLGLLLADRLRRFAPAVMAGAIGFVATLSLLNVDVFIVGRNVSRLAQTDQIDVTYLGSLSNDAIPHLVSFAGVAPDDVREELLAQLACRQRETEERFENVSWPSYHLSHEQARRALSGIADVLADYPVTWEPWDENYPSYGRWVVEVDGEDVSCANGWMD
jgi:CBS domain-containing protein